LEAAHYFDVRPEEGEDRWGVVVGGEDAEYGKAEPKVRIRTECEKINEMQNDEVRTE
jgi:hypothetical protein